MQDAEDVPEPIGPWMQENLLSSQKKSMSTLPSGS